MGDLGHLEHPFIIVEAPHQQRVLRYLPEVCKQAVYALLAQLLCELLGVRRSTTCKDVCSRLYGKLCSNSEFILSARTKLSAVSCSMQQC